MLLLVYVIQAPTDWQILMNHNQTQVALTGPNFQTGYMFFLSGECVRMKRSP